MATQRMSSMFSNFGKTFCCSFSAVAHCTERTAVATERCAKTQSRLPWKVVANFNDADTKVVSLLVQREER